MLSIAFCSIGFIGKLFCEALEEAHPGPVEALSATGCPEMLVVAKDHRPEVAPAFWSLALLRWDINIHAFAVPGESGWHTQLPASNEDILARSKGAILRIAWHLAPSSEAASYVNQFPIRRCQLR